MQPKQIQGIKDKINGKIQTGDYVTLSKILDQNRHTVSAQYKRDNAATVLLMQAIVKGREKLISNLRKKVTGNIIK